MTLTNGWQDMHSCCSHFGDFGGSGGGWRRGSSVVIICGIVLRVAACPATAAHPQATRCVGGLAPRGEACELLGLGKVVVHG